jgi:hypothetical protein
MEGALNRTEGSVNASQQAGRFSFPTLRGAAWALRSLRRVRAQIGRSGISPMIELPPAPKLPGGAVRGINAALRRRHATCLERALVLQAWLASRGEKRDLVIGVTAPDDEFRAHAWLDGEEQCHDGDYRQLVRRPAPSARA